MSEQNASAVKNQPQEDLVIEKLNSQSWWAIFAAFIGFALDAMDWMILSLVLALIAQDFQVDMVAAGALATATLLGAGLSGLVAGIVADRYGRVKVLVFTMLAYSIMTALCGFVTSYLMLLVMRFFTGVGLGAEWGCGAALVSETWPSKYRAWATSAVHSGWPVGYGLAALAYMLVVPEYGWRGLFFVGIIPSFVAIFIALFVKEPAVWVQAKARRAELKTQHKKEEFPIKTLFTGIYLRRTILAIIMLSAANMAYWGAATWIPSFLSKSKGLDIAKTGSFLIMLNAGGIVGHQIFGYLSGKIGRRNSMSIGMFLSIIATLMYVNIDSNEVLFWFGPFFALCTYGFFGTLGAYFSELYPVEARATGASFNFSAARFMSMLSPILIGWVSGQWGFSFGIGLAAAFYLVSIVCLRMMPETRVIPAKA